MNNEVKLPEGHLTDLEAKAKYFKTSSLDHAEVEEEDLASPDSEEYEKGTAYKRAVLDKHGFNLGIYPDKSIFLAHLHGNTHTGTKGKLKWGKSHRVLRDSLRVGGDFKANPMEDYLYQDNVKLDQSGVLVLNEDGRIQGYFQSSHLKAANETPRHLFFKLADNLLPKKSRQKHFELGEALHACLMEPTRFGRYVVAPVDPKNTHEGIKKHMEFWKGILEQKLINDLASVSEGKEAFRVMLADIHSNLGIIHNERILEFFTDVKLQLVEEKIMIRENHSFIGRNGKIEDLYKQYFGETELAFAEKKTEDPLQIILKELTLVKNQSLGESKKDPFDTAPKKALLDGLVEGCKQFIIANTDKEPEVFTSLAQKQAYVSALSEACDMESVNEDQYLIIKALELNAKQYGNGIIYKLAKHAHRECSAYLDDYDGLPMKVRPDMIQFEENIGVNAVISVKSTSSPNIGKFFYDTAKYQYELSEGMYQEVLSRVTGREFRSTITIMYQTVEPYGVAVFWWNPEDLELGRHKFWQAVQTLKDTLEQGIWPGYDVFAEEDDFGVIDFALPWWAYKGLEERNQKGLGQIHPTGDIE